MFKYTRHIDIIPIYNRWGEFVDQEPDYESEVITIGNDKNKVVIKPYKQEIKLVGNFDEIVNGFRLFWACELAKGLSEKKFSIYIQLHWITISKDKISFDYPLNDELHHFLEEVNKNWKNKLETILLLRD